MVLASLHHLCSWHFYWDYCHTSSSVQDKLSGTQMIGAIVSAICCPGQSSHHQEARCLYIYIKPECEYWGCQECRVTVKCWWHIQWWVREAEGQGDCWTYDTYRGKAWGWGPRRTNQVVIAATVRPTDQATGDILHQQCPVSIVHSLEE